MSNLHEELTRYAKSYGWHEAECDWCQANEHRDLRLALLGGHCYAKAIGSHDALRKCLAEALLSVWTGALSVDGRCAIELVDAALEKWLEYGRRSVDSKAVAREMEERHAEYLSVWQATDEAITPPDGGG